MKLLKRLLFAAAALYLLAAAALYTLQRSVLYVPPTIYLTPAGVNLNGAEEVFSPKDPQEMLGWWMPPKDETFPVVMFFHGNGSAIYSNQEIYKQLVAQGFGVFALAYPGYPGREGETTQDNLTLAAQAGYDFIASKKITADRIVFYGTSLGAGVAAQLSRSRRPALIIMEAPFTSAADMGQLLFPMFPSAWLTKDKLYSDKALAGTNIPLLWMHGTQDRVIPFGMGQTLYQGYDGPKTSYIDNGGGHTDLWYRGGDSVIIDEIHRLSSTPVINNGH